MRIALVDPSLFTLPYDQALARGLLAIGHDVTLFGRHLNAEEATSNTPHPVPHFYRIAGGAMGRMLPRTIQLGMKGIDHVGSMLRLQRRFRKERPDVIHFQWLPLPVVDRHLLAGFRQLAPLVMTVHDTNPFNGAPSAELQSAGMERCFSHFDRLIVHTTQGRGRLVAQGVDEARLVQVPHGLLEPLPTALKCDPFDGEVTLLLFGRIKPYKGLDVLIEAFAQLPATLRHQARIRVVGKPFMDLTPLLDRAHALRIADRLTLETRFLSDDEVPALFTHGTIAVFPYREIEASGVLSLALAHGRPVVASSIGGFKEVLQDGVQGLLVPPDDVAALSAALGQLLANRCFASHCGTRARALAETVPSWEDIGRNTVSVYRAALGRM